MFGSIYSNHLDYLKKSFRGMNKEYHKKDKNKASFVMDKLQQAYIKIFGIPEIGFQMRYFHFKKTLDMCGEKNLNRILDAGCGIGCYTVALARQFKNSAVVGVDNSKRNVHIGKTLARELRLSNIVFKTGDISKRTLERKKYDFIICIDVLEHIEEYQRVLKNFYQMLRPGGYLYIHVPQMHQKRFFKRFQTWSHEGHVREGFVPSIFDRDLKKIGFHKIRVWNTFGTMGSIAWELNHLALSKSFVMTALIYPLLLPLVFLDRFIMNRKGLAAAYLYKKI
ncbi:MAG: class I SAM-dependent methyltransferase [Candidatus Gottesmanbacteria bacterium]